MLIDGIKIVVIVKETHGNSERKYFRNIYPHIESAVTPEHHRLFSLN